MSCECLRCISPRRLASLGSVSATLMLFREWLIFAIRTDAPEIKTPTTAVIGVFWTLAALRGLGAERPNPINLQLAANVSLSDFAHFRRCSPNFLGLTGAIAERRSPAQVGNKTPGISPGGALFAIGRMGGLEFHSVHPAAISSRPPGTPAAWRCRVRRAG